ncbi:MAG: SWIM zinc finger family protein [bacterium]|nr:SWIM zinc finger family protein [bacterium]
MPAEKSKRTSKKRRKDPFADLTWENLESWAGSTIVGRGRTYQWGGRVDNLGITPEGKLIAWVIGTERYITQVEIQDGELTSKCTCPYWAQCKHAVAVALEYLECLKNKDDVPHISKEDPRLDQLKKIEDWEDEDEEWEDEDEWEEDEDWEEDLEQVKARTIKQQRKAVPLSDYFEKHTKAELVELIGELTDTYPDVREFLEDRRDVRTGNVRNMVKAVREEISTIEQPDWDEYGRGYASPNFTRLEEHLQALLQAGHADEIIHLGQELMGAAQFAIETYDHDGEVGYDLESCIQIIFQALTLSSLSSTEQLKWAIDMEMADEYDLCSSGLETFWKGRRKKSDWGELADELQKRLDQTGSDEDTDGFSYTYQRDRLSNWLIGALENAGRKDEIVPLCEREAEVTGSYVRLVDRLIAQKRFEEAERWCQKGIKNTDVHHQGTGSQLRDRLRTVSEKTGDHLRAVAFLADDFFTQPSLETFGELCKAARKARVGTVVEPWARYYLETGHLPRTKGRRRKEEPARKWPLPETGFRPESPRWTQDAPMTSALIQIAIAEKEPADVLKWFDLEASKSDGQYYHFSTSLLSVAEAIKRKFPERAIEIWKTKAESAIARVQVSGYQEAGGYLRHVRDTLKRIKKQKEWEAYLNDLRTRNKNRPRCVEVLDWLAGKRIIDG